jgi:hypothetical protein
MKAINQPLLLPLRKIPEPRLPPHGVRLLLRRKLAMLLPPLWKTVAPPRCGTALPVIRPLLIAHIALVTTVFLVVIGPLLATHVTAVFLSRAIPRFAPVLLTWRAHLAPTAILKSPVRPVKIATAIAAIFMRLALMPAASAVFAALGPAERRRRQKCAHHEPCQPPAGANRDFSCARHHASS